MRTFIFDVLEAQENKGNGNRLGEPTRQRRVMPSPAPPRRPAMRRPASTRSTYTRSPLQDSRLFGPSPWKILAATYEQMGS